MFKDQKMRWERNRGDEEESQYRMIKDFCKEERNEEAAEGRRGIKKG